MLIKTYSKAELRALYGVSRDTFSQWIRLFQDKLPHYNPNAKLFTPAQVKVILEHLGEP